MKFGFLFLLFVFVIASVLANINIVEAVGFSPSSLTFDLEQGQEGCKMITIDSESETIKASDRWAKSKDDPWSVSSFNESSSSKGIKISYDNELSIDEREVEVCLSGSNVGEYHGVLLFQEEQNGSSIIQFGVWLKALITEKPAASSGGGSGGGGGGAGLTLPTNSTNKTNTTSNSELIGLSSETDSATSGEDEDEKTQEENYNSKLTGRIIESLGKNANARNLAILGVVLVAIVALAIYTKRKNKQNIGSI